MKKASKLKSGLIIASLRGGEKSVDEACPGLSLLGKDRHGHHRVNLCVGLHSRESTAQSLLLTETAPLRSLPRLLETKSLALSKNVDFSRQ
jgi:hypothetical protein